MLLLGITLTLTFLVGVTTSEYDPWLDNDSDGDIDIFGVVLVATAYGTTGKSERNVSVTNWPSEMEYFFFNYKYGSTPVLYKSSIDNNIYSTDETSWVTMKEYHIDATILNSNISTAGSLELDCQIRNDAGINERIQLVINGANYYLGQYSNTDWQPMSWLVSGLNQSSVDNEVLVQICATSPGAVRIKDMRYRLHLTYDKYSLFPCDFDASIMYLRSLTLMPEDAVELNDNPTQTICNFGTSEVTYEFNEKVILSQIDFIYGTPEISILIPREP